MTLRPCDCIMCENRRDRSREGGHGAGSLLVAPRNARRSDSCRCVEDVADEPEQLLAMHADRRHDDHVIRAHAECGWIVIDPDLGGHAEVATAESEAEEPAGGGGVVYGSLGQRCDL